MNYPGRANGQQRTSRKKLGHFLAAFTDWIRTHGHRYRTGELLSRARSRLAGHLQYDAITDNSDRCQEAHILTTRILFKWLNRRSQRKSYNWQRFGAVLNTAGWPVVQVRHSMCPFRPLPNA